MKPHWTWKSTNRPNTTARNPSLFLTAQGIALITSEALKRRVSLRYLNFLEREAKGRFSGWREKESYVALGGPRRCWAVAGAQFRGLCPAAGIGLIPTGQAEREWASAWLTFPSPWQQNVISHPRYFPPKVRELAPNSQPR